MDNNGPTVSMIQAPAERSRQPPSSRYHQLGITRESRDVWQFSTGAGRSRSGHFRGAEGHGRRTDVTISCGLSAPRNRQPAPIRSTAFPILWSESLIDLPDPDTGLSVVLFSLLDILRGLGADVACRVMQTDPRLRLLPLALEGSASSRRRLWATDRRGQARGRAGAVHPNRQARASRWSRVG